MPKDPDDPRRQALSKEVDRLLRGLHPAAHGDDVPQPVISPPPVPKPAPGAARPGAAAIPPNGTGRTTTVPATPVANVRSHGDPFPTMRSRTIGGGINGGALAGDGASKRVAGGEPPTPLGVWGRVALCGALTIGMTQWPYADCGLPLIGYFLGVAMILIAGVWASHAAWRAHIGRAHIVALLLVLIGTALGADQILPRVGYASAHLTWGCSR